MKLTARQTIALRWLGGLDLGDDLRNLLHHSPGWPYAWQLADVLTDAGFEPARNCRNPAQGASNTLVALKRAGLATNSTPGGEAFQSVRWAITGQGREALRQGLG